MMEFLGELLRQSFLQHALIGGVLASIGCGIMGSYVVVKRIGFLAGGISHAVLGGMGVALFFSVNPLAGALVAALAAAILIGWISLRWREQEDTLISAVWAVGMAIGILFISRTPGYNVDLMSYLFGNILIVSAGDLWLMAGMDAAVLLLVLLFYRQFLAVAFDEEFARLRGVPVPLFYLLLLSLVALTVVLLIQVVGLILVIALLTLPAAIALQYVHSLGRSMALAALLGMVFTCVGLVIAYQSDLPAGATIILVAGIAYLLSTLLGRWRLHRTRLERKAA
jgi:zinc transport system permease protein